jgi:hypothetical protein
MDIHAKIFRTGKAVGAARCKAVTYRAWSLRNRLFSETRADTKQNRLSLVETCIVRAVVVLTENDVAADDAIWFADKLHGGLRMQFEELLCGERSVSFIGFHRGPGASETEHVTDEKTGRIRKRRAKDVPTRIAFYHLAEGEEALAAAMVRTRGFMAVVNLRPIVDHVLQALNLGGEEFRGVRHQGRPT